MFAASKTDGATTAANYVEEVFSTYLYTGNGSTQTITNGIDLSTYGGLVWNKLRNNGTAYHYWVDTARGRSSGIGSNSTDAQYISSAGNDLASFTTTGYTLGPVQNWNASNLNGGTIASWTFRKQAKFFDVVTYTGTGTGTARTVAHNLGSVPGCIIVKSTSSVNDWPVYHRSLGATNGIYLNRTDAAFGSGVFWNNTAPTSTEFTVKSDANTLNVTYVAYLFAHDAGGFGLTGTDNVISCGSFTANGNNTITLGYEPQWVMVRRVSSAGNDWEIYDTMRGMSLTSSSVLNANTSGAEGAGGTIYPTATGFYISSYGSGDIIYIAIRRGPMKVPTSGTSVFNTRLRTSNGTNSVITGVGFPPDAIWGKVRNSAGARPVISSRFTGTLNALYTDLTNAESGIDAYNSFNMDGFTIGSGSTLNTSPNTYVHHCFKRAPGFFDIVCYSGTGSNRTVTHNLGATPELMLVKRRDTGNAWAVYANNDNTDYLVLNATDATVDDNTYWNDTSPTASVFSVGTNTAVNASGSTYIAYLFATITGVSKVGSYTGSGATKQIDCGFTAGARYVFIKRVDSTSDWYVWDSERGIVSGNDPYLLINKLDAEVTNTDYIDPLNAGFEISSTAPAAINANGGTFIFLAIA